MSTARRVAIVTCREFPALYAEEQQVLPRLRERGIAAEAAVWDDPAIDWSSFDAVVLRSVWDYFRRYPDFCAWLAALERQRVPLFNPLALVRWNADKHYLLDLERAGVPIVSTAILEPGDPSTLAKVLGERAWERAVIKPAVSGSADHTHPVSRATAAADEAKLAAARQMGAVLVQPFAPEIPAEGEWSLVFFRSEYSHAVLKKPAAGDFRVQQSFGASTVRVEPSEALRRQARRVIEALPAAPLYARIDGIRRGDVFLLMEAEVIEPYLYLESAPEQMESFVAALASTVGR